MMTKINNYIRYLLTLILLGSINVYAQTSTSSINTASFAEIIKQNMDKFVYYLINYALPFLAVYGILIYLAQESGKEINRPLHLIFFIMAFLATISFHNILNIFTLVFTLILVIVGFHKIFHGITGSIIGFLVAIAILIGVLINDSLKEFLSSTAYFIFLFVLFIIIFILSIKIGKELPQIKGFKELMGDIKKLSYLINKPEDIRKLEEQINKTIEDFRTVAKTLIENIENIEKALFNSQNQQNNQNIMEKIKEVIESYRALQQYYKDILTYINNIENNINIYDEAIRPQISNFLNMKKKELLNIKNSVDSRYNSTLNSPRAKQIINHILVEQTSQNIREQLQSIEKQIKELKNILKKIKKEYNDLINLILSINTDDYNKLIESINNLIKNAQNFLRTLNKKQKFDSKYEKILTNLKDLQSHINKIPDQNERARFYTTVKDIETSINNYHQNFYKYYNQYRFFNNLISRLISIKDDMETLEDQIEKLKNYQQQFMNAQKFQEKRIVFEKFKSVYNDIWRVINKIDREISTIHTSHINTGNLSTAIEDLKTKLRTAIRKLNKEMEQLYNETEKSYYVWLYP